MLIIVIEINYYSLVNMIGNRNQKAMISISSHVYFAYFYTNTFYIFPCISQNYGLNSKAGSANIKQFKRRKNKLKRDGLRQVILS